MKNRKLVFVFYIALFFTQNISTAQPQSLPQSITARELDRTIDSICTKLTMNYVSPEVANDMAQALKLNFKKGNYQSVTNPSELAVQLTKDLQTISHDKHLRVIYDPAIIARERALTAQDRANEEAEWIPELIKGLKRDNYGFREVKIMDGNIGYLDLREFVDPQYGGETLTSTMRFLANTHAIILDLRQNDGGNPAMVQLISSYFFDEPVLLFDFYNRPRNESTQSWTLPFVPGTRVPDVPLYILTSSKTFSAAESFAYAMKNLKRATLVGEVTSGGAHLTGSVIATDKFFIRIPQGKPVSPITKTNWEGTGVSPDIAVTADQALKTAHAKALESVKK